MESIVYLDAGEIDFGVKGMVGQGAAERVSVDYFRGESEAANMFFANHAPKLQNSWHVEMRESHFAQEIKGGTCFG